MMRVTQQNSVIGIFLASFILCMGGCGPGGSVAYFEPTFMPSRNSKVTVGEVTDSAPLELRGDKKSLDIAAFMQIQLNKKLKSAKILASSDNTNSQTLRLTCDIVEYEPGNAFGRWMLPGLGTTRLRVRCKLYDEDKEVGSIRAIRSVNVGGVYSIGQWKHIFGTVAKDIAKELKNKFKK